MKLSTIVAVGVGAMLSVCAYANDDAILGKWQTYEDNQPKAVVEITKAGDKYTGKIIAGNTDKAKQYVGRTVITGLGADGNGKYSGGRITDPVTDKNYRLNVTLNGNTLRVRGSIGIIGRTQTWQRIGQ